MWRGLLSSRRVSNTDKRGKSAAPGLSAVVPNGVHFNCQPSLQRGRQVGRARTTILPEQPSPRDVGNLPEKSGFAMQGGLLTAVTRTRACHRTCDLAQSEAWAVGDRWY